MAPSLALAHLSDLNRTAQRLHTAGLSRVAAAEKATYFAQAAAMLLAQTGATNDDPIYAYWVPGRIEVLGKHTDYAGGHSLLAAAERGFCFVATARADRAIRIHEASGGESITFEIDPNLTPKIGHWANYPMTVVRRLARNFSNFRQGANITFVSDLPPAAGMSSSSALIVGNYLMLAAINRLEQDEQYTLNIDSNVRLAEYLGTIENGQSFGTLVGDRGVGTFGGSEDHTAILCCRAGRLSRYAYCPTRFQEHVGLPAGHTFIIGASGVVAEKTGSAQEQYNRASRLAAAVVAVWNKATGYADPHLAALVERGPAACTRLERLLSETKTDDFSRKEMIDRFVHFRAENSQIIPAAMVALEAGDVATFGETVDQSQALGARLLGNQVPETIALAALARAAGASAASAFGAGFGGSVWALVENARLQSFIDQWRSDYLASFPSHTTRSRFFATTAGPAALRLGI